MTDSKGSEGETAADDGAGSTVGDMAMTENKGRLELTWSNKDRALLSREDGSYEWVPKRDHRVAEVRLLRDAGSVGEVHEQAERAKDNLLIRGDALNALTALTSSPEFSNEYAGKVKLAYIDPPFNTGQAFEHYDDGLEHSVWLTMMRDRLMQIKELLSLDGSVWVHLDDAEMAYCRVLLDEIFGRENFVAMVVWEKADSPRNSARQFSTDHDYILIFGKSSDWTPNRMPRTAESDSIYRNPDNDPRGEWNDVDPFAGKSYSLGQYEIEGPTGCVFAPPPGKFWRISEAKFWELDGEGRIWWGNNRDARPSIKSYLSEVSDLVPRTLWRHADVGSNRTSKSELRKLFSGQVTFDTPKPERLMERIIQIGSNEGDVVLDCFAGSGTTAAVAHKMNRRWITVELEGETIDTFTAPRLKKVVDGSDQGGITESVGWSGHGGFRVLDVSPSIFDEDEGVVVLADWVTKHALAEAVAAQLGFAYEVDQPFCGKHGRVRLAVIDGHADEATVRLLVKSLGKGEKLSLCATSLDPEAAALLAKLKRGSQARVVPQDILLSYRTPSAWRVSVAREDES